MHSFLVVDKMNKMSGQEIANELLIESIQENILDKKTARLRSAMRSNTDEATG